AEVGHDPRGIVRAVRTGGGNRPLQFADDLLAGFQPSRHLRGLGLSTTGFDALDHVFEKAPRDIEALLHWVARGDCWPAVTREGHEEILRVLLRVMGWVVGAELGMRAHEVDLADDIAPGPER